MDACVKWFEKQSLIVKVILLIIPFVNWVLELIIRWNDALKDTNNATKVVIAVLSIFFGVIIGYIDVVWLILNKKILRV